MSEVEVAALARVRGDRDELDARGRAAGLDAGQVEKLRSFLDPTPQTVDPSLPHVHDFGTGGALVCSVCKLSPQQLLVQSGGRAVGPEAARDDGFRFQIQGGLRKLGLGQTLRLPGDFDAIDVAPLERIDVVAHDWGLKRRPGEDEASLATRIRRASASTNRRPGVPPMSWTPPPGFRLGDDWRKTPIAKAKPTMRRPIMETAPGQTLESDGALDYATDVDGSTMKRVQ